MSPATMGDHFRRLFGALEPGGVYRALVGWAGRVRERNLREQIHARARWVSEAAAPEEFRFLWDEESDELDDLLSGLRKLPVGLDEGDLAVAAAAGGRRGRSAAAAGLGPAVMLAARDRIEDLPGCGSQALAAVGDFGAACPYPGPAGWEDAGAAAARTLALVWIRALLGADRVREGGAAFYEQVYLHQRFLARRLGSGAGTPGTRLFAAAAQAVAGLAFPVFPESDDWRDDAMDLFEDLLLETTYADGVGRAQNTAEEARLVEAALLLVRLADRWEFPVLGAARARLERVCEYYVAVHAARDPAATMGDPAAGPAFRLPLGGARRSRSLAAVAGVTFERQEWARLAMGLDPQAILMLGDMDAVARFEEWTCETQVERFLPGEVFPHGGRFFFRTQRSPSLTVGFDAGEMGAPPRAAGAHADALGITIELDGQPVVVDPGGLAAPDDAGFYDYFRSTGAHSTVRVNWEDSAADGGDGGWARATPRSDLGYATTTGGRLVMALAAHEGYSRDGNRVTHRRMVTRDSGDSYHLALEDRIEADREVELEYELLFHFDARIAAIQKQRELYQVRVGEAMLSLRFSSDNFYEVGATQGHTGPLLGWSARGGGDPAPIWVLRVHGKDKTPIVIRTALFPGVAPR